MTRLLLFATGRGVSTSVLVSHVDSVSLVQLSWYLGSMIASARLPPQPIEIIIHGRCSWGWRGLKHGSLCLTASAASPPWLSTKAPSVFPSSVGGSEAAALLKQQSQLTSTSYLRHPERAELKVGADWPQGKSTAAIVSIITTASILIINMETCVPNETALSVFNEIYRVKSSQSTTKRGCQFSYLIRRQ